MKKLERQYNLFNNNDLNFSAENPLEDIYINKKIIMEWQEKIIKHQSPIFKYGYKNINQPSLFESISFTYMTAVSVDGSPGAEL